MSRIRSIKPEFWTSEQVLECSTNARLMFIGLWNFCDDAGRHPYSAKQAKAEVFPADDFTEKQIVAMLMELETHGLIVRYHAENKEYFYVSGWKHQRIDKPQEPKYPDPFSEHSKIIQGTFPPDRIGEDRIGRDGNGMDGSASSDAAPAKPDRKPRKKPVTDLPDGFECDREESRAYGFTDQEHARESNKFKNWHSAKGSQFADWRAAWRTWIGKAAEFAGKSRQSSEPEKVEVYSIKLDSPEWEAWYRHTREHGPKFVHSQMTQIGNIGMGQMAFRSRWPPPPEAAKEPANIEQEHAA